MLEKVLMGILVVCAVAVVAIACVGQNINHTATATVYNNNATVVRTMTR